ncbi:MAG: UDP-N-acetylmuramoyl-L-alanyl-D-glutamate--2,6-diaminopimelate ligase [Balneolaceae bacterium]|nr:UDP-N-acetylmuramoyl-L-alanyl-D-glutamate--2,6-diaminopimelate ligase [Balneolaceae bacterium]
MTPTSLISLCEPRETRGRLPERLGELRQDSRRVVEGDVFIAVRGTQVDGHAFAGQAVDLGASVLICEHEPEGFRMPEEHGEENTTCLLLVDDTRRLLGPLAQAFHGHPARELKVVAVTGTNGKTTVATLAWQVLHRLGVAASLLGTVAKKIGAEELDTRLTTADPIELAADMRRMVDAGSTHLVMEVSSHALDQQRTGGIDFEVGAFTNLSHDHLDYHKDMSAYAGAKKKLFDAMKSGTAAVINADDAWGDFMCQDTPARVIRFSYEGAGGVDCRILHGGSNGLTLKVGGQQVESPLLGPFNAYNVAQAFLICREFGFPERRIAQALADAPGAPGRLERVAGSGEQERPLVLVDYAHTPDALENVLSTLAAMKNNDQELHVIFGCGGDRDTDKRPRMADVAETLADRVTVTSDNPRSEDPEAIIDDIMEGFSHPDRVTRLADRRRAIRQAVLQADGRQIILIAGKGHETYQEIQGRRLDFDDRRVARDALMQRNGNPETEEVA